MAWLNKQQLLTVQRFLAVSLLLQWGVVSSMAGGDEQRVIQFDLTQPWLGSSTQTIRQQLPTSAPPTPLLFDCEEEDLVPPQLELLYSDPTIIDLDGCSAHLAAFEFEVVATDNCSDQVAVSVSATDAVQLYALGQGKYLALLAEGARRIDVTVEDEAGLTATSMLPIQINKLGRSGVSCAGSVTILMDGQCQVDLLPEQVLVKNNSCLNASEYLINVLDDNPENGGTVDLPGSYSYSVNKRPIVPIEGFSAQFATSNWRLTGTAQFESNQLRIDSGLATIGLPEAGQISLQLAGTASRELQVQIVDQEGEIRYDSLVTEATTRLLVDIESDWQLVLKGQTASSVMTSISFQAERTEAEVVCWGTVDAKDNNNFDFPCPTDVSTASVEQAGQLLSNNLAFAPFGLQASAFSCLQSEIESVEGPQRYRTYSFTVDKADRYTFALQSSWGNGIGALYAGSFRFNNPCENILAIGGPYVRGATGQPASGDPVLYLSTFLEPGQSYTLLTIGNTVSAPGAYSWEIYSDGDGRIVQLPLQTLFSTRPLIFNDLERLEIPSNATKCYTLDAGGNVQIPEGQADALALERLLEALEKTGYPGDENFNQYGSCNALEVCVSERISTQGDCDEQVLLRSFRITGDRGQFKLCEQRIIAQPPSLGDVILPPSTATVECDENFPTLPNGNPSPLATGGPRIATTAGVLPLDESYATIDVQFEDKVRIPICEGSYKFAREWTIVDWCNPAASRTFQQIVQVKDKTPPTIRFGKPGESNLAGNQSIVTGGNDCVTSLRLNIPTLEDACGTVTYTTEVRAFVNGVDSLFAFIPATDTSRLIFGIPVGNYRVVYTATDDCGNSATDIRSLRIRDGSAPNAIAIGPIQVSLFTDSDTRIQAAAFDAGSNDACGPVTISVARQFPCFNSGFFTGFSSFVRFECCDVGKEIPVILRARDRSGNLAFDTTLVKVVDKRIPECAAPADTSVVCTELPPNFDPSDTLQLQQYFGIATGDGVCGVFVEEMLPIISGPSCNGGTIIRRFRSNSGVTEAAVECTQRIQIIEDHSYAIRFPADAEAVCGLPTVDTLQTYEYGCDVLAVNVDEKRLNVVEGACFKVERTYSIINWCEYDGQSDPIILGRDEDCDGLPGDEPLWLVVRNDTAFLDRDSIPENQNPVASAGNCPNPEGYWRTVPTRGYFEYTQVIKVIDDTPPQVILGNSFPVCISDQEDCTAEVEVRFTVEESCTPEDISIRVLFDQNADGIIDADLTERNPLEGLFPKFIFRSLFPLGNHALRIEVTDACGNVGVGNFPIDIVDCKAPTPICINGLTATLGRVTPDNIAAIVPVDLFIASEDGLTDCSGPITYSINRAGGVPDINQKELVFTCEEQGYQEVEIYAWDTANNPFKIQPDGTIGGPNFDFCTTYILIQDDNEFDLCPGSDLSFALSGSVLDLSGNPVSGVAVQLSGAVEAFTTTNTGGQYQFTDLGVGAPANLEAVRNVNWMKDISTLDIVYITRHILEQQVLADPLALLAADVNASGNITILDALHLQRIILGLVDTLPLGKSFLFATEAPSFDDWMNPEIQIHEIAELDTALANTSFDFTMFKAGDVSGIVERTTNVLEGRSQEPLRTVSRPAGPSNTYEITLDFPTVPDWQGAQFALRWPIGTELIAAPEGQDQFWTWKDGLLKLAASPENLGSKRPFEFSITLRIPAGQSLTPRLEQDILRPEVYHANLQTVRLALESPTSTEAYLTKSATLQLWPNPAAESFRAEVQFQVSSNSPVQWRLLDAAGRIVRQGTDAVAGTRWERRFQRGTDYQLPGAYWLWIQTEQGSFHRQVVVR